MLFVIIHEEFALETVHLTQHTDIRHISYLSMASGMNRLQAIKRGITKYLSYFQSVLKFKNISILV